MEDKMCAQHGKKVFLTKQKPGSAHTATTTTTTTK